MKNRTHLAALALSFVLAGNSLPAWAGAPRLEEGKTIYLNPSGNESPARVHDTQSPGAQQLAPVKTEELQEVIDLLSSPASSPFVRRQALKKLEEWTGRTVNPLDAAQRKRASSSLLPLMQGNVLASVRASAAEAMGILSYPDNYKDVLLASNIEMDASVLEGIFKGLILYVKSPLHEEDKKKIFDRLSRALDEESSRVGTTLMAGLIDLMGLPTTPPDLKHRIAERLREAARHPNRIVRLAAVKALRFRHSPEDTAVLVDVLGDSDALVRQDAAGALKDLKDPALIPAVKGVIKKMEKDSMAIFNALQVFLPLRKEVVSPVLLDLLKELRLPEAQGQIIWALGEIHDVRAVSTLVQLMVSQPPDPKSFFIPVFAGQALVKMGDAAVPPLLQALQTGDARARFEVAERLRLLPSASPELRKWVKEGKPEQQMWAALAIGPKPGPEAIPALKLILQEKDPSLKARAVGVLGAINHPDSITLLKSLLDDADPSVKRAAQSALKILGVPVEDLGTKKM